MIAQTLDSTLQFLHTGQVIKLVIWPNFSEIQASGESCNFEKSAVFQKNRFALGNFSSQSVEIEVVLVVCLLCKEKKMATRVSAVREVLGLPAEDSLLLAQHDEGFFEEAEVAESSSSSSDDDLISDRSASGASDDSEQEENLDSVDLADRSTGSLADLLDDEPAPKRPRTDPTTLEEVSEKVQQGCKCSRKNCFVAVPTSALWNLRRMTEAINSEIRETFLAGQLL